MTVDLNTKLDMGAARRAREQEQAFTPTDEWQGAPTDANGKVTHLADRRNNLPADTAWPDPLDVIGAPELVGWPELSDECLPAPLYRYVMGEAERLNVDPCPLAGHVLAACSASINDIWQVKPKRHDHWTQQTRIWCCVVKDVGQRGTEMIRSGFWPVKERDAKALEDHKREHTAWKERNKDRKKGEIPDDDPEPKLRRFTTSDATIEAASEILQDKNVDVMSMPS